MKFVRILKLRLGMECETLGSCGVFSLECLGLSCFRQVRLAIGLVIIPSSGSTRIQKHPLIGHGLSAKSIEVNIPIGPRHCFLLNLELAHRALSTHRSSNASRTRDCRCRKVLVLQYRSGCHRGPGCASSNVSKQENGRLMFPKRMILGRSRSFTIQPNCQQNPLG